MRTSQKLLMIMTARPGGGAWTPASVPGLVLWLKASDLTGADGSAVASWTSREGNSYEFAQATAGNRPLLKTGANGINGRNVVRFDGSNDYLRYAAGDISTATSGTLYIVYRLSTIAPDDQALLTSNDEGTTEENYLVFKGYQSGSRPNIEISQAVSAAPSAVHGSTILLAATVYVAKYQSSGTVYSAWINGAVQTMTARAGANDGDWWGDTTLRDNFIVGAAVSAQVRRPFKGDVAEILLYDALPSVADAALLDAYLEGEYGLNFSAEPPPEPDALVQVATYPVPEPNIYGTGVARGELNSGTAGKEIVYGAGTDLYDPPYTGVCVCLDAAGNTLWTYTAPNNSYIMLLDIGDVDEDGDNEIALGTQSPDNLCVLLDHTGQAVWTFPNEQYVRFAKIGKVRDDYAGKQVVMGGRWNALRLLDKDGNQIWSDNVSDPAGAATVQGAQIVDLNGDGDAELVIPCGYSVHIYDHLGDVQARYQVTAGTGHTYAVDVGHVTSLTDLQIAAANQDNLTLLNYDGTEIWKWVAPSMCWSCALGDVDGDGYAEIVAGWGNHITLPPSVSDFGGVSVLSSAGVELARYNTGSSVKAVAWDATAEQIIASCDDGHIYVLEMPA